MPLSVKISMTGSSGLVVFDRRTPAGRDQAIERKRASSGLDATREALMDAERTFLASLSLIERIVQCVCRRYYVNVSEREDFESSVKLRLIDNDYAILRQFQHESSLGTYLKTIIERMYLDQHVREWGRWRPAVRARQLGAPAILLDGLVNRDGLAVAEALRTVRFRFPGLNAATLKDVEKSLHVRRRHCVMKGLTEEVFEIPGPGQSGEDVLLDRERDENARRVAVVLKRVMSGLAAEDRLLLRLLHCESLKIAHIADRLHLERKPLYRRLKGLHRDLRTALSREGLGELQIAELIAHDTDLLDLPFGEIPPDSDPSNGKGNAS